VIGRAACRGAATIVNAIATGKGAAFGITLETDAEVKLAGSKSGLGVVGQGEGDDLVRNCVLAVAKKAGRADIGAEIRVESEIPISRGLKSSSAVTNAVVLAVARALAIEMADFEIVLTGIEESIKAGVTVTGAFDDASACFMGGVVATENRSFTIMHRGTLDPDLVVLLHVPDRRITKASVKKLDFSPIAQEVEKAFDLALRGEYLKAMELNSRAYSKVLDVSEDVARLARRNGALAAGISGTGPATAIVCDRAQERDIMRSLERVEGKVLKAHVNDTPAREVVPRLL
jgi:shikimate kinase